MALLQISFETLHWSCLNAGHGNDLDSWTQDSAILYLVRCNRNGTTEACLFTSFYSLCPALQIMARSTPCCAWKRDDLELFYRQRWSSVTQHENEQWKEVCACHFPVSCAKHIPHCCFCEVTIVFCNACADDVFVPLCFQNELRWRCYFYWWRVR